MERRGLLPKFKLGGFVKDVGKGIGEQAKRRKIEDMQMRMRELKGELEVSDRRVEEARERWEGRQIVEWRREEREERNKMWTTPGCRPLTEPPVLDWEEFVRMWLPSDLRFKALFPDDPELRCRAKDVRGENAVLTEYGVYASLMAHDPEAESTRRLFYENLCQDLYQEYEVVVQENKDIGAKASNLARFEFTNLDNDGRTTRLEEWIKKGAYILEGQDDEVRKRYGYLLPPDFVESRLATFVFFYDIARGGVAFLITQLENGVDVFKIWNDDKILAKYGHLQQYYRPILPDFHSSPSDFSAHYSHNDSSSSSSSASKVESPEDDLCATLLASPTYSVKRRASLLLPNMDPLPAELWHNHNPKNARQRRNSIE